MKKTGLFIFLVVIGIIIFITFVSTDRNTDRNTDIYCSQDYREGSELYNKCKDCRKNKVTEDQCWSFYKDMCPFKKTKEYFECLRNLKQ